MGFNKCYVPEIEELENILEKKGVEHLYFLFHKCDCLIGDSAGIDFLTEKLKEYKKKTQNE